MINSFNASDIDTIYDAVMASMINTPPQVGSKPAQKYTADKLK